MTTQPPDDLAEKRGRIGRRPGGKKRQAELHRAAEVTRGKVLPGPFTLPRPMPPVGLAEDGGMVLPGSFTPATVDEFRPAPDLRDWVLATFVGDGGDLANPDHSHLRFARVAWLWTNQDWTRKGRRVAGTAELGDPPPVAKWARGRWAQQMAGWFGGWWYGLAPDFLITLDATICAGLSDAAFCALVEHELYHCAQERDEYDAPAFYQSSGLPKLTLRAHDVEEFVGVVARYGPGHSSNVQALVDAVAAGPTVAPAAIQAACGTCAAPLRLAK
jgi:hypothetical protein